jgi:branched-chain amino acid transport system substrate-binding protein
VADILGAEPPARAVIMVGAYKPTAAFVKALRSAGATPLFLNVSFVGSEALASELGEDGDGVIITQVVPPPDSAVPVAVRHRDALKSFAPGATATFGSLEGYVAAQVLFRGLSACKGTVNREAILVSLESLGDFDVGLGETLHLSPDGHQACHRVWPTVIRSGRITAFEWDELTSLMSSPHAEAK